MRRLTFLAPLLALVAAAEAQPAKPRARELGTVSYTHLTLPTSDLV